VTTIPRGVGMRASQNQTQLKKNRTLILIFFLRKLEKPIIENLSQQLFDNKHKISGNRTSILNCSPIKLVLKPMSV
jgi:hypothetical protein